MTELFKVTELEGALYFTLFYCLPSVFMLQTMSVEFVHVKKGKDFLREFVERRGYVLHSEVVHENNLANDFIFVKSPRLV